MDQVILSCSHPFDHPSPIPQPSRLSSGSAHLHHPSSNPIERPASTERVPHQSLDQHLSRWSQIYIRYLNSSSNPQEFSKRMKDLVGKRLPKKLIEALASFHSSERDLVSVESYNQLIGHYYRFERYDQARKLMKEMEERGISKNQETQELIACSYQALNKFRGVRLALDAIEADGHRVSDQCLTRLFSIRPRKSSKLQHFDLMDQPPIPVSSSTSNPTRENTSAADPPPWVSIQDFLNSRDGNPQPITKDGRAIVTLVKRLMEIGRWREAYELVDTILDFDVSRSAAGNSRLAISSYWATSLLDALVFGLYNAKQKSNRLFKSMDSSKIIPAVKSSSNWSIGNSHSPSESYPLDRKAQKMKKQENRKNQRLEDLPLDRVFEFVEKFIDRHRNHNVKINHRVLLNCLRIQTSLSPSQVKSLLANWTDRYGMSSNCMGSRLGVRFLHVISAWFIRQLRFIKSQLSSLEHRRSMKGVTQSELLEPQESLKSLVKEYLLIDRDLINCLNHRHDGHKDQDSDCEHLIIEDMILKGPIDGRLLRSNYRFISFQDLTSIKLSLKKIYKIHTKILDLLMISFSLFENDNQPPHQCQDEQVQEVESRNTSDDSHDELDSKSKRSNSPNRFVGAELLTSSPFFEFYGNKDEQQDLRRFIPVNSDKNQNERFNSYFYHLIYRFQGSRSPDQSHFEAQKVKSLNMSLINYIPPHQGRRRPRADRLIDSSHRSTPTLRSSCATKSVDRHPSPTHSMICCWSSEHLNSAPIYFKPSSSP